MVDIKRRGKVVARLSPPPAAVVEAPRKPWERLRGSGALLAEPGESVLDEQAFVCVDRSSSGAGGRADALLHLGDRLAGSAVPGAAK